MSASSQQINTPASHSLADLYASARIMTFKKGRLIFVQDEIPRFGFAVKSGVIRAFSYTDNLEEKSISLVVRNEMLPIGWLYSKTTTAFFNYIAHTDCELYVIDSPKLHSLLANDASLAYEMLQHSINDFMAKVLQIHALEQPRADLKLLYTLRYLALRHGKEILKDLVRITIPLTQKDLASFTGLTRETVTHEILRHKKTGILSVRQRYYTVNVSKLESELNESPMKSITIAD